jgi:hypothetical protein
MVRRILPLTAVLLLGAPPAAGAAGWRSPVDGAEVAAPFAYERSQPFAAGQRRGADLRARPGAVVRATCAGRVWFAGRPPSGGLAVSVRCGRQTATLLGLGALAVARGRPVARGAVLGRLGRAGILRVGARVTADRWGWVDPLALQGPEAPPGAAPAPGLRRRRGARPPAAAPPRALPVRAPVPARGGLPAALWAGVALLAAGLGAGGVVRRRTGRRGSWARRLAVPRGGRAPRR